ncbi:MAG: NADH-quinone oxidoreductase subunit L [Planctomycetes bacterium]|nr:NADH-quinone oxidoreductase subunit L [Planctomycetota bacterium]
MFAIEKLILWIPALPLLAALITALLGPKFLRSTCHIPAIIGIGASFLFSLLLLTEVRREQDAAPPGGFERIVTVWNWANLNDAYEHAEAAQPPRAVPLRIDVVMRIDALTSMMLCMVTSVATLVAVFAAGYMHGDRGYWRFFSYVSLFVFSMTMLVSVSNFALLFVFWEAVGVCSYLLIGFWYEKPEAAAAGKKAFLVNRVGDFGFALALFLIWTTYGTLDFHDSQSVDSIASNATAVAADDSLIAASVANPGTSGVLGKARIASGGYVGGAVGFVICALLLLGACGKSAQFPLHVWLPDAMEGPTPVSALIHAATMVTAGVYMVARCTPLFMASPDAQVLVSCVGGLTALLAGLIALTQWDLKRVLAYSTVSQLGFMFLGLGTGSLAGITAAMFHLFTHAFFKAVLFLGAGSVMHAMGNVIDMRRFGGLRRIMPITYGTFLIGSLALAGVPPLAGFWSKDAVLGAVHDKLHLYEQQIELRHAQGGGAADATTDPARAGIGGLETLTDGQLVCGIQAYGWLYYAATLTAFLTAFYTLRALLLTFHGTERVPHEAHGHAHESPASMTFPLMVLAAAACIAGLFFDQTYNASLPSGQRHSFAAFLASAPQLAAGAVGKTPALDSFHLSVAATSVLVSLAGIGLAMYLYLGDTREVRVLTSLFNLDGVVQSLDVRRVFRWRWVAALDRMARRAGLGLVATVTGYLLGAVLIVVSAPLLVAMYVSPYRLSQRKFYFDELYDWGIVRPLRGFSRLLASADRWLIDSLVNFVGAVPPAIGAVCRRMQTGLVPFYALAMLLAMLLLLASQL